MNKIIVLGCSFSKAFSRTDDDIYISWPEMLQIKLNEAEKPFSVDNLSQYCSSLENQLYQLKHELLKDKTDLKLIILQFTTSMRQTFIKDEETYRFNLNNNLKQGGYCQTENYYEYDFDDSQSDYDTYNFNSMGVIHLNAALLSLKDSSSRIKSAYIQNMLHGLSTCGPLSMEFSRMMEQEMVDLCKENEIPYIAYRHVNHRGQTESDTNKNRKYLDFILSEDMTDFLNYCIDDGYHFDIEGNNILLNNFLLPRIEKILHV